MRCAVSVGERPSAAAASGDVRAVLLHQFKAVQRILQRKRAYTQQLEVTVHHPGHDDGPPPPAAVSHTVCVSIHHINSIMGIVS